MYQLQEIRFRKKYLDLLTNPGVRPIFETRAKVVRGIRRYLEDRGFLEVETPMLFSAAGGAAAQPFVTKSRALGSDLFLRIAPELFLKQLVIGGYDRVFEIGKVFRNEGIDATHNPEFTICEFYQAYADYHSLMDTAEEMISDILSHDLLRPSCSRSLHVRRRQPRAQVILDGDDVACTHCEGRDRIVQGPVPRRHGQRERGGRRGWRR